MPEATESRLCSNPNTSYAGDDGMKAPPPGGLTELKPVYVDEIPRTLEPGILYISERSSCSIHLCACGWCGEQTVMPFRRSCEHTEIDQHLWVFTEEGDIVTLYPSVGNWQMPCRSHYYITRNKVEWL